MQQTIRSIRTNSKINLNSHIDIQTAKPFHIPEMFALNKSWFKDNLNHHHNGFLSVCYHPPLLEEIIKQHDALVFLVNNCVHGYILVNTVFDFPHSMIVRQKHEELSTPKNYDRIAYSYQIVLSGPLQGSGFFYIAQHACRSHFKKKYDYLVSTVNKLNQRSMQAHKKSGWHILETPENYNIIELNLS